MRTYLIISKLLHSKKQVLKSIIHLFVIFLVISYITESFFQIYSEYIKSVWPLKYAKYDVKINFTTEKDYREQITQNNVEAEVMFSQPVWSGKFIHGKKEFYQSQETNNVYGVSLGDSLRTVVNLILPGCIVKKDETLFSLENAILISDEIAMQIGAKVGDSIYVQLPVNEFREVKDHNKDGFDDDLIYEFKVAAIYRKINIGNAIVFNDIYRKIGIDWIGEKVYNEYHFSYKNNLYISFKDKEAGINESKNFLPTPLGEYIEYGDDWKQKIDYNDYKERASSGEHFLIRDLIFKQTERRTVVDTSVIAFYTTLVAAAIALLFINNNYKTLKLNNKNIGILSSSGMPRRNLFLYFTGLSFIEQCLIFILSHLCLSAKFHLLGMTEFSLSFNPLVVARMYTPLLIGAIIASIISGIFAINIVSKKKMLEALSAE